MLLVGNGGVFERIGRLAGGAADIEASLGGTATARTLSGASWQTRGTNIQADAAFSPNLTSVVSGAWTNINGWASSQSSFLGQLATLAQGILTNQVQLDAVLQSPTPTNCLVELIRQMRASTSTINASSPSVGGQATVLATGTPVFVVGLVNTYGDTLQTPYAETIRFNATADQNSGATLRQEPFTVTGAAPASSIWAFNWPAGSGGVMNLNLCDSQLNNAGQQLQTLFNGDMETFTANYPQDWTITTGVAGTDITAGGSGNAYTGTNCLELLGDGSTLSTLYEAFNTPHSITSGAGGTPYKILPATRYTVNLFAKSPSAPSAGVLRVALVNGSNTVINSDNGSPCSLTIALTGLTSSYVAYNGTFATPTNLPSSVRLQLSLTTAISSTKIVYIDDVAFTPSQVFYGGVQGPTISGFAGATPVVKNDAFTVAISNTFGLLALWLERFFGLRSLGLQFPATASSPTVADSVVA